MKPIRMCLCCRNRFEKDNLLKIVKNKQGKILIDKSMILDGRGAYICYSEDCHKKLMKQKMLNKTFKCQVSEEIYEEILKVLSEKN